VDARNCASRFAAFASDAVYELGDNMIEFAFLGKLIYLLLDFRSLKILYGHSLFLEI
jgi:hypothetical protein